MDEIITLSGKIDSSNANEEDLRITDELNNYTGKIIIDVSKLSYISSAGLRVILKIKKEYPDTKIINCNNEVFEIFEMTGFTQMMDIKKAFKNISIDGCDIIDEGAYGIIYRIDSDTVVKVYKNPDSLEEIIREKENAKKAFSEMLGTDLVIAPSAVTVIIPKSVRYLGARSFAGCKNLYWVRFEEAAKVENILKETFADCPMLEHVDLPRGIKTVHKNAFTKCNPSIGPKGISFDVIEDDPTYSLAKIKKAILTEKRKKGKSEQE